jgi:AraC-like DNA-binding protein
VQVVHDTDGAILPIMEMIYRAITERGDGYHKIADSLLEAICAYLTRYVNKKTKYEFVDSFKGLLYENLSNPDFDVSEEIEKSGYSKDHFRRCFKEETGLTPLEHLTVLRINRAKKLLRATPYQSIGSIAAGCGFSDEFYFSRVFRKETGISPREYRKKYNS